MIVEIIRVVLICRFWNKNQIRTEEEIFTREKAKIACTKKQDTKFAAQQAEGYLHLQGTYPAASAKYPTATALGALPAE